MTEKGAPVTHRELELDDDGWWTVWEDGDHIGMFLTEGEALRFLADLAFVEGVDRWLDQG